MATDVLASNPSRILSSDTNGPSGAEKYQPIPTLQQDTPIPPPKAEPSAAEILKVLASSAPVSTKKLSPVSNSDESPPLVGSHSDQNTGLNVSMPVPTTTPPLSPQRKPSTNHLIPGDINSQDVESPSRKEDEIASNPTHSSSLTSSLKESPQDQRPSFKGNVRDEASDGDGDELKLSDLQAPSKLYHDDGNLILVAENSTFRIHKGFLLNHCPGIFDHCESIGDTFPVTMNVPGVPPQSLRVFLNVIYSYRSPHFLDREELIEVLILSTRYQADQFREQLLASLTAYFPTSLAAYDAYRHSKERAVLSYFGALVKAKANFLLPVTFYFMCSMTRISHLDYLKDIPTETWLQFYRGKDALLQAFPEFLEGLSVKVFRSNPPPESSNELDEDGNPVITKASCCEGEWRAMFYGIWNEYGRRRAVDVSLPVPLEDLLALYNGLSKVFFGCNACAKLLREEIVSHRKKIWDSLPMKFGVAETWEELSIPRVTSCLVPSPNWGV